jgi:Family of unknown function (DUF6600)
MPQRASVRRLLLGLVMSLALAGVGTTLPVVPGAVQPAYAQILAEFQEALAPYGHWERHPRWGAIWVPDDVPPDWRPYEYGHWVYTDEWGWYWISDPEEEDWGWVTFHYGRWRFERRLGWFWIPDDEWAPAWVDWRYGDNYVGWAPMPPEEIIYEYDDNPTYWVFVSPRFLTAPRLRAYIVPQSRRSFVLRRTHVVNRTLRFERGRAAVNAGLSPAFVARVTRTALPTYRVRPRVLSGTQGVAGAVRVTPQQLGAGRSGGARRGRRPSANRVNAVAVQPTTTTIKPAASAAAPAPLGKGERGKLGSHPPRAAQGGATPQQQRQNGPSQPPPVQKQQQLQKPQVAPPLQRVAPTPPLPSGQRQERRNQHPPSVTAPAKPQAAPPPQVKSVRPIAPQTPPSPPKSGAQHRPPIVKQAPPPTVKRVVPPAQPKHPMVRHAPPPKPVQAVKPPPTVKKQAAPAKPATKPNAKKKPDGKKKPGETPK